MIKSEKTNLYLLFIVGIVAVVGIMVLIMGNEVSTTKDIAGEAVAKAATTKAKTATTKTSTTSKITTLSTKGKFCGDASCVDGTHVSCYENTKGDCECDKCKISTKSWEFQKPLKGIQKTLKEKKAVKFSLSQINIDKFITLCQTERRYETGVPIIDAFMMEFLGETDEETLEEFAELLEIAYCDAMDGKVVIRITPMKYTPTKSDQFTSNSMLSYQPFIEEDWDETFEELEDDEDYDQEWVEETRALTYGNFLSDEDIDDFYYEWLYERSIYAEIFDYYSGLQGYAKQMGYNDEDYDLLIVLSGIYNEEYGSLYSSKYNLILLVEKGLTLCPTCEGYYYQYDNFEKDLKYLMVDRGIHELGHFTGAEHACETSRQDNCESCSSSDDVMSYCTDLPESGETFYNEFSSCSMDFFNQYYIPNFPDGSSGNSYDEYYSCE